MWCQIFFSVLTHLVEHNDAIQYLYLSPGRTLECLPVLLNFCHFLQELMKLLAEQMDSLLTSSTAWCQVLYLENVQDLLNEPSLSKI